MGRKVKANKSMLFASIIIMILCQISTVNSENTGLQEQPGFNEKRVLSFDRPTLFMFGEQTAGPVNEWPTWNHANNADEARYVFAVLHFLRSTYKMFFGNDGFDFEP